jgi:amidohydrolase
MGRQHSFAEKLREIRRQLHRRPEIGFALDTTRKYLAQVFRESGIRVVEAGGGLVADIGEGPGRVLLRADMDALPVTDGKKTAYVSQNEGACHACGHDGHMAMLFGAGQLLNKDKLPGSVRLILQPCEERPPGGALGMIEAGVLDGVDAAFALHLTPDLPFGVVGVKAGVMMAAVDNFTLTVTGKGGHGAQPHSTVDAILAASHVVAALQALVSRMNDPVEPLVLTVGKFNGGNAANVVADNVVLEGTVRTLREDLRSAMPQRIRVVAESVCAAFGAGCKLDYLPGYPLLENDQLMAALAIKAAEGVVGKEKVISLNRPLMVSEDFSYFLQRVPGCFVLLGTGEEGFNAPLHHPGFDFNEDILPLGAEIMAAIAVTRLKTL